MSVDEWLESSGLGFLKWPLISTDQAPWKFDRFPDSLEPASNWCAGTQRYCLDQQLRKYAPACWHRYSFCDAEQITMHRTICVSRHSWRVVAAVRSLRMNNPTRSEAPPVSTSSEIEQFVALNLREHVSLARSAPSGRQGYGGPLLRNRREVRD